MKSARPPQQQIPNQPAMSRTTNIIPIDEPLSGPHDGTTSACDGMDNLDDGESRDLFLRSHFHECENCVHRSAVYNEEDGIEPVAVRIDENTHIYDLERARENDCEKSVRIGSLVLTTLEGSALWKAVQSGALDSDIDDDEVEVSDFAYEEGEGNDALVITMSSPNSGG